MRDWSRFEALMDDLATHVYPEPALEPHIKITTSMIDNLFADGILSPGDLVLDIGCGQGMALEQFGRHGANAVGIGHGPDIELCRSIGLEASEQDQHFLDFADRSFDLIWARHVLEHSFAPMAALAEYARVLRLNGFAYVEVPAPETAAHHERNPNHYSVLPRLAWMSLFERSGFTIERDVALGFESGYGPDMYWAFLLRRKSP